MSKPAQSMDNLFEKIRHLPAERVEEVENFVDFLQARSKNSVAREQKRVTFPVISVGRWPQNLSLRREDMYNDDGR